MVGEVVKQVGPIIDATILGFLQYTPSPLDSERERSQKWTFLKGILGHTPANKIDTRLENLQQKGPAKLNLLMFLFSHAMQLNATCRDWFCSDGLVMLQSLLQDCHSSAFHPACQSYQLLPRCLAAFDTLLVACTEPQLLATLQATLWKIFLHPCRSLGLQFAIACFGDFLERAPDDYKYSFVRSVLNLLAKSNNLSVQDPNGQMSTASDDKVHLTLVEDRLCSLLVQVSPLLDPKSVDTIVACLALEPKDTQAQLALTVKAHLVSLLPLPSFSPQQKANLLTTLLRPCVDTLHSWLQAPTYAPVMATYLECVCGVVQHSELLADKSLLKQIADILGRLLGAKGPLISKSSSLLRAVFQLACCTDILLIVTPSQLFSLLASCFNIQSTNSIHKPFVAHFLGNVSQIQLDPTDPLCSKLFAKLSQLSHSMLELPRSKGQTTGLSKVGGTSPAWCEFAAGLVMFHTFSSFSTTFQDQLEDLIPAAAYDEVVQYITNLAEPSAVGSRDHWKLLSQECEGSRQFYQRLKRSADEMVQGDQRRSLKRARTALISLEQSMQDLLQIVKVLPPLHESAIQAIDPVLVEKVKSNNRLWKDILAEMQARSPEAGNVSMEGNGFLVS